MSIIKMSPEFIATIQTGRAARVVSGGALMGAKVRRTWLEEDRGLVTICVDVDDGLDGDREIVFENIAAPAGEG